MYELTDALKKTTKKTLMIDVTTTVGSCADLAEEQHQNWKQNNKTLSKIVIIIIIDTHTSPKLT